MNTPRRPTATLTLGGIAAVSCLLFAPPGTATAVTGAATGAVDGCLTTRSVSDFNGDGFDDAAVGDPYATVGGVRQAGAVTVLLGGADGRIGGTARTVITRADLGETPRSGDHFGYDVALAPTGHRGSCAGLLVGTPGADVDGAIDAGLAHLISDLPDSEGTPWLEAFVLTQANLAGSAEPGDNFGYTVMITGTNQEDRHRLIIGAPGENVGAAVDAGSVGVFEMDAEPEGLAELRQGQRGPLGGIRLPGNPQSGDRFGAALTGGPLDLPEWSGTDVGLALIIGAPGDHVTNHPSAGSVTVLQEKYEHATLLTQATANVPGTAETGDGFGASVALNPHTATRAATLAVGTPNEDAGSVRDTGSVTLFRNVGERLVPLAAFSQATPGVPGTNETGDRFGSALAVGHHSTTLLIGVPDENIGNVTDAGAVQPVLLTSPSALKFLPSLTQNSRGTTGSVGTRHHFGNSLGALSGKTEHILTIGVPYSGTGSVFVLSDNATVLPRSWASATNANRFGWSTSN